MKHTTICIAGLTIGIHHIYNSINRSPSCFFGSGPHDFEVTIREEDISAEREKVRAEYALEGLPYEEFPPSSLETTAIYRKIGQQLPRYGGVIFHGSAVAIGERAYLFTAKSGTGKTTHTNLWLKTIPGSYIVDGDKPILRLTDGGVTVCGTPWNGKEGLGTNAMVPLKAICLLERGEENRIRQITFQEALSTVIGQTYRSPNRAVLAETLKIIGRLGRQVDFYRLSCNMEDEAALVSFRGMVHDGF